MEETLFINGEKFTISKKEYVVQPKDNTMLIDIFYMSPVYDGLNIKSYEEKSVQFECSNCYV